VSTILPFKTLQDGRIEFEVPRLFLWNMMVIRTQEEIRLDTTSKASLESARSVIETAKKERRVTGLSEAETLYRKSQDAYLRGDYDDAAMMALRAKEGAGKVTKESIGTTANEQVSLGYYVGPILAVTIITATTYLTIRKRKRR